MINKKIKLLFVDDSQVYYELTKSILDKSDIEIIDWAKDGVEGIEKAKLLKPDVLLLDYQMPKKDGIEVVKELMVEHPVPIIMFSTYTKEGADVTNKALQHGAVDFLLKPEKPDNIYNLKEELISKIRIASRVRVIRRFHLQKKYPKVSAKKAQYEIVVVGISTGGPKALNFLVSNIPENFDLPFVICQHMPEMFTKVLAEQLDKVCPLKVKEIEEGEKITGKTVYIAKGGINTYIHRNKVFKMTNKDIYDIAVPSCNLLFKSAALAYKEKVLAIIMTGMGSDGTEGLLEVKRYGGYVIAQDETTSTIFGMPKSAIEKGCVDEVLTIGEIINKIRGLAYE